MGTQSSNRCGDEDKQSKSDKNGDEIEIINRDEDGE